MKKVTAKELVILIESAIEQGTITEDTPMAVGSVFDPPGHIIDDESTRIVVTNISGREYGLLTY